MTNRCKSTLCPLSFFFHLARQSCFFWHQACSQLFLCARWFDILASLPNVPCIKQHHLAPLNTQQEHARLMLPADGACMALDGMGLCSPNETTLLEALANQNGIHGSIGPFYSGLSFLHPLPRHAMQWDNQPPNSTGCQQGVNELCCIASPWYALAHHSRLTSFHSGSGMPIWQLHSTYPFE